MQLGHSENVFLPIFYGSDLDVTIIPKKYRIILTYQIFDESQTRIEANLTRLLVWTRMYVVEYNNSKVVFL